ncbi:MAG: pyridoxamine 5'-phosphate oxidase [Flavobacteriales bacterium CG_4_10_14_0_2_um_filter_32_8]|nr:MAG: pyridoxamine 5'-phosphate oxidase [Flavobacteriales bacterium CG_4_10_14_0_2_um_filter_32_8]PJB15962.1 MAG: pyridoxamine 5'-phosphate oxidase [Flavobacteriales bacterium CG_4_9_14_3_um_filter_32_8]
MNEDLINYINGIRRDFAGKPLNEEAVDNNPIEQFQVWLEEAINAQLLDPYAMSITTVHPNGQPSSRIVYMRGIKENGFVFYTNYNSDKAKSLDQNNKVALSFFWVELERQIRIEGEVKKVSEADSDTYFSQRPRESQIGAWASNQSETIKDRAELEEKVAYFTNKFKTTEVPRPPHWGGYLVVPTKFEFWQGRPNRLHDRIIFTKSGDAWKKSRLAP